MRLDSQNKNFYIPGSCVESSQISHSIMEEREKSSVMPIIDLKDTRAGMVLGQDIHGAQGQLLLRAGAVLNDKHLQVLHANHISKVVIGTAAATVAAEPLDPAMIEASLQERFSINDGHHPLIEELRRLCHQRLTEPGGSNDK